MDLEITSVLNVDDYAPGRYARSKILRQAGFDVIEATTGSETLKLALEHKPAVVLLDVNLPDMHGFEVCRRLRTNPVLAATTILHVSASSIQEHHMVRGLDTGADGYLVEPRDVVAAARFAVEILSRADRGREMGQRARINAKRKYCSNDVIPQYEAYYRKVLGEASAISV